jgi:dUTPase
LNYPYFSCFAVFAETGGSFVVEEGDRVAQLIIEKIQTPEVMEVEVSILLLESQRYS